MPVVPIDQIDLAVVPGLAFDLEGRRLGRGKGYYDRFLAQPGCRALAVAVAFEFQVVPTLPSEKHDRDMTLVFTEDRIVRPSW
jgi:5-formyltetrahydrofolate cyclo-ligase